MGTCDWWWCHHHQGRLDWDIRCGQGAKGWKLMGSDIHTGGNRQIQGLWIHGKGPCCNRALGGIILYVFIKQSVDPICIVPRLTKCQSWRQLHLPKEVGCLPYMVILICCFKWCRFAIPWLQDQIKTPLMQHRYMHHLSSYLPSQCLPLNALPVHICARTASPLDCQVSQYKINCKLFFVPPTPHIWHMLSVMTIKLTHWGHVANSLCNVSTHSLWLTPSSSLCRSRYLQVAAMNTSICMLIICTYKWFCLM